MFQLFDLDEQYRLYPQIKREEVEKLLEWALMQPHLPKITEHEALLFFYACNCSMEYAKHVLDLNCTCRTHFHEFFGNVDVESPEIQQIHKVVAGVPLPQRTPEGYAVIMVKLLDTDPAKFHYGNSVKLYSISQDKWFLENGVIKGLIIAIDMTDAAFGHLTRINLIHLKKAMYFLQEAIPTRLMGLHFLNANSVIDKLMSLMQPFLKKELLEMLHIHTSMETFYKFVPREILPRDFGGPGLDMRQLNENFFESLRQSRFDIIEYNANHKVNEKLRPAKAKHSSDLFGTEGNFKKLDID
ncbi:retinaldehyde-binding protein 1-like [Musca vetustissima]|uniref:retinaldehyde-binding protein 1-like n=1 Tax=Musca vetustissima TaxID=27455 RepID=UPI002AB6BD47|nr:retinaldehyde-binding protein 1-like [Musca vetustissima]